MCSHPHPLPRHWSSICTSWRNKITAGSLRNDSSDTYAHVLTPPLGGLPPPISCGAAQGTPLCDVKSRIIRNGQGTIVAFSLLSGVKCFPLNVKRPLHNQNDLLSHVFVICVPCGAPSRRKREFVVSGSLPLAIFEFKDSKHNNNKKKTNHRMTSCLCVCVCVYSYVYGLYF